MKLRGKETSAAEVYDKLVASINNVFEDVMQFGRIREEIHKEEYDLFHNSRRVVDGPWLVLRRHKFFFLYSF